MQTIQCFVVIILMFNINLTDCESSKSGVLSRHKRYVVFPEGSSLTVAFCITMNLIEVRSSIFTELINFGINYDLPNKTIHQLLKNTESKETARRRYRRELYNKIEIILNAMGLDGKTCVYKSLCEVSQILQNQGQNMLEEIVRRLFYFPLERLHYLEPDEHRDYHWAHKIGREKINCKKIFPNCHVSIIEMLLGYNKMLQ